MARNDWDDGWGANDGWGNDDGQGAPLGDRWDQDQGLKFPLNYLYSCTILN